MDINNALHKGLLSRSSCPKVLAVKSEAIKGYEEHREWRECGNGVHSPSACLSAYLTMYLSFDLSNLMRSLMPGGGSEYF